MAATKPLNDLFRKLRRHPTQSTSDKGRNNLKPHATIAYLRKDKVEAFLHSLQGQKKKIPLHTEVGDKQSPDEKAAERKEWKIAKGGMEFLLNESCQADRFEFGWRDGRTSLIRIGHTQ